MDSLICSHTLEDIRNPIWLCQEINRVAKSRTGCSGAGSSSTRNSSGRTSAIISPSDDDNGSVYDGGARSVLFRVHGCLNEEDRRKALQPRLLDPFVNTL